MLKNAKSVISFLINLSSISFIFLYLQNTSIHQNGKQLGLVIAKIESRVKSSVLNHDIVVKFGGNLLILQLTEVDFSVE